MFHRLGTHVSEESRKRMSIAHMGLRSGYQHKASTIEKLKQTAQAKRLPRKQKILELLTQYPDASIKQLASLTGIPKTCVHRIVVEIRNETQTS